MDFKAIEDKWRQKWQQEKVFESDCSPGQKKYFLTAPYPYANSFLHIGHLFTYMRLEALARFKRLTGHNVLMPMAFHCTGSPIESAAQRVKEKEPKQIEALKKLGLTDNEIKKFAVPKYWTKFFPNEIESDFKAMGLAIDWRRKFITTSLNPHYNAFIEWQFRKLKNQGLVVKGEHPVVWDPITNSPIGDHDRSEGEGETPQEFLLVKHKLDDGRFLVSATLRPDTILGTTNVYVHPDAKYAEIEIEVNDSKETWILGEDAVKHLEEQDWKLKRKGTVSGMDFVNKETEEFGNRKVPVLPATFIDAEVGTGLVHSVPSESADDLIALWDLQKDKEYCKKYNIDSDVINAVKPIEILETDGTGNPAEHFLKKYGVKHQNEHKKLEQIRKELYKYSFYNAKFGKIYKGVFEKDVVGKPVQNEQKYVKKELIKQGWAETYYELTGKVISRNLNKCIVKIVKDQWFMNYSNEKWKEKVRKNLKLMNLYPEKSRHQFENVIDWIQNWACSREFGLGTKLPWDQKWVIESLSDSTIYMAFYTISHILQKLPVNKINDELFDYVFGHSAKKPNIENIDEMKKEFEYWYPMDFRNSGKDLIQNHLIFMLFNHTAIFDKKYWPQGIGVNGWVTVNGEKMSKSRGNIVLLREMSDKFGVDVSRFTILNGGEELDDPNWDSEFAKALHSKLNNFYEFCTENYGKGSDEKTDVDAWMDAKLNMIVKQATDVMELTLFRTALQKIYFELTRAAKWYVKRTNNKPNKKILDKIIEAQVVMMSPFTCFLSEEIWEKLGKEGFVANAKWPEFVKSKINDDLVKSEDIIADVIEDVNAVFKLANVKQPKSITLFIAEEWKNKLFSRVNDLMKDTRNPGEIMKQLLTDAGLKKHGQYITKILPNAIKNNRVPETIYGQNKEYEFLNSANNFLKENFGCNIDIVKEQNSDNPKSNQAFPGKPAIFVE